MSKEEKELEELKTKVDYRMIHDVKSVKELTRNHVEQVKEYIRHQGYAKKGLLYVASDTKVPHKVRRYAKESNIKVERGNIPDY